MFDTQKANTVIESLRKHVHQFISIEDKRLFLLEDFFELKLLKKKETILNEGNICREKFFINKGCLQLFFIKRNGTEQTIDFALENWWTTDFNAFSNNSTSAFSIRSIEPCEILVLKKSSQEKMLQSIPELEQYFHLVFQKAYAASQRRIKLLYEFSREELYLQFSKKYPDFVQRIPQYLLASFLGFSPEYLSEIRKKFIS